MSTPAAEPPPPAAEPPPPCAAIGNGPLRPAQLAAIAAARLAPAALPDAASRDAAKAALAARWGITQKRVKAIWDAAGIHDVADAREVAPPAAAALPARGDLPAAAAVVDALLAAIAGAAPHLRFDGLGLAHTPDGSLVYKLRLRHPAPPPG